MIDFKELSAKSKMQHEAKAAIRAADYKAAAIITVGGGKAKMLIDLAEELIQAGKVKSIVYACDSTRLRDSDREGFPAELNKWGSQKMKLMTTTVCYQTTQRWEGAEADLFLADEVDFSLTPSYTKVHFQNKFKYIILVSGTLTKAKEKVLELIAPIVYRLSTEDAEERGIVNRTNYYIYNYMMTDEESKKYLRYNAAISKLIALEDVKGKQIVTMKRKNFLARLDSSVTHTRKIMKWLWDKDHSTRLVIFTQLREQADRVCKYSYHGDNEKEDNLTRFQNFEISAIAVVAKIRRGINLKRVKAFIVESLSGSTTELEQRLGRAKRLEIDEYATIIFMVPWFRKVIKETGKVIYTETIVKTWIEKATANFKNIKLIPLKLK